MSPSPSSPAQKTVLVTGGGRGIGAGIVDRLAAEGWNVAFSDLGDPAVFADRCAALAKDHGVQARYYPSDVGDVNAHDALVAAIVKDFGALNALVNNAGVAPKVRMDLLETTPESYDRVMGINLRGPFFLTQRVARYWAEQKKTDPDFPATLVNISSCSSTVVSISRPEYCLSKTGVSMATNLFAVRLGELDIPVYEIRPGVILTEMTGPVKEKYDRLIAEGLTLQKRWGYPEDIAKAVAMMLRGDIAYSTGQVVNIGGGMEISKL